MKREFSVEKENEMLEKYNLPKNTDEYNLLKEIIQILDDDSRWDIHMRNEYLELCDYKFYIMQKYIDKNKKGSVVMGWKEDREMHEKFGISHDDSKSKMKKIMKKLDEEEFSDDDREQLQRFLISTMQAHLNMMKIN